MPPRTVRRLIEACSLQTARLGRSGICPGCRTDARCFSPYPGRILAPVAFMVCGGGRIAAFLQARLGAPLLPQRSRLRAIGCARASGKKWTKGNRKERPGLRVSAVVRDLLPVENSDIPAAAT